MPVIESNDLLARGESMKPTPPTGAFAELVSASIK